MKSLEIKQISDVFEVTSSKRVFESDWTDSGVPFLRTREIVKLSNNEILENGLFISEKMYKEYTDKYGKPQEGDLLVTAVGTLGATYIVKNTDKFYFKDGNVIWLKKKTNVSSKYIQYCFISPFVKNQILKTANSAVVGTYTITNAKKTQIPLPPLPQQQKIANILDAADALRQNDKALIAKYDELAQALFLDMFGDPVSSKIIELGEVIKLIGGGTPSKMIDEYWIGTIPWASVKDLKSDLLTSTIDHISEAAIANSATNLIPAGSLIIATRMAVGKTVICLQDTAINQDLKAVKIIGEANVKFLQHLFKSKESYFDSVSSGATVKGIKIEHITKLKVPFPPIELQNQFADRVAVIEEQKAIAQKSLEKSESLFNSLLQKAFKGELV